MPPAVGQQQGGHGHQSSPRTSGLAVASLVFGIVQVFIWVVGAILALAFGYRARRQIDESGGTEGGRGMAIAGIVLGWVGVGLAIGQVVLLVVVVIQ